jgi:23S rRNA-/tRNA-specific pseudouridylate synthase/SAM-dependent methyltransferase
MATPPERVRTLRTPGPNILGRGVRILHQDGDVLVVEKPPGLLTSATPGSETANLADRIRLMLRKAGVKPSRADRARGGAAGPVPIPGVIHRLDREASGVVVFSTSARAYPWLKEDFKSKRVHRMYLALVHGQVGAPGESGTIQSFLKEAMNGRVVSIAPEEYRGPVTGPGKAKHKTRGARPGGDDDVARLAVTHYRVLGVGNGLSLVQVRLASGRKHQIRVHLASKGHSIVGDRYYGKPGEHDVLDRLGLHASELGFTHPGTGQSMRWVSPAPAAFYRAVGMEVPRVTAQAEVERPIKAAGGDGPSGAGTLVFEPKGAPDREAADTSWNKVAAWYDNLIDDRKSDHYSEQIVPGVLRLVGPEPGLRVLDVACGQGVMSRALAQQGCEVVGVDAAPKLIEAARGRGGGKFFVGDAREVGSLDLGDARAFDCAVCVMALTNIEPVEPVLSGIAQRLAPGGACVLVISHPAFRAPGQTAWAWDQRDGRQFRRVDGYLSTGQHRIQMHPGENPDIVTWTFHRPLQHYVQALRQAGLAVTELEEWASRRVSQAGPRAEEENRARREIPLFMAIRAEKR